MASSTSLTESLKKEIQALMEEDSDIDLISPPSQEEIEDFEIVGGIEEEIPVVLKNLSTKHKKDVLEQLRDLDLAFSLKLTKEEIKPISDSIFQMLLEIITNPKHFPSDLSYLLYIRNIMFKLIKSIKEEEISLSVNSFVPNEIHQNPEDIEKGTSSTPSASTTSSLSLSDIKKNIADIFNDTNLILYIKQLLTKEETIDAVINSADNEFVYIFLILMLSYCFITFMNQSSNTLKFDIHSLYLSAAKLVQKSILAMLSSNKIINNLFLIKSLAFFCINDLYSDKTATNSTNQQFIDFIFKTPAKYETNVDINNCDDFFFDEFILLLLKTKINELPQYIAFINDDLFTFYIQNCLNESNIELLDSFSHLTLTDNIMYIIESIGIEKTVSYLISRTSKSKVENEHFLCLLQVIIDDYCSPTKFTDSLLSLFLQSYINIPINYKDICISYAKQSNEKVEQVLTHFAHPNLIFEEETVKNILQNSQNPDLFDNVSFDEIIEIFKESKYYKTSEFWILIITKFNITQDILQTFKTLFNDDVMDKISEIIYNFNFYKEITEQQNDNSCKIIDYDEHKVINESEQSSSNEEIPQNSFNQSNMILDSNQQKTLEIDEEKMQKLVLFCNSIIKEFPLISDYEIFGSEYDMKIIFERMDPTKDSFIPLKFWYESEFNFSFTSFVQLILSDPDEEEKLNKPEMLNTVFILNILLMRSSFFGPNQSKDQFDKLHVYFGFILPKIKDSQLNKDSNIDIMLNYIKEHENNSNLLEIDIEKLPLNFTFFYMNSALFWNQMYSIESRTRTASKQNKKQVFCPPESKFVGLFLYIGGTIIDKLPIYNQKTRINVLIHSVYLYKCIFNILSSKESLHKEYNMKAAHLLFKWIVRDIYTYNKRPEYNKCIAEMILAYFESSKEELMNISKITNEIDYWFLYAFIKTLNTVFFQQTKEEYQKKYGQKLSQLLELFIKHVDEFVIFFKDTLDKHYLSIDLIFYKIQDILLNISKSNQQIKEFQTKIFLFSSIFISQSLSDIFTIDEANQNNENKKILIKLENVEETLQTTISLGINKHISDVSYFAFKHFPEDYEIFLKYFIKIDKQNEEENQKIIEVSPFYFKSLKLIGPKLMKQYKYHIVSLKYLLNQESEESLGDIFMAIVGNIFNSNDVMFITILELLKTRDPIITSLDTILTQMHFVFPINNYDTLLQAIFRVYQLESKSKQFIKNQINLLPVPILKIPYSVSSESIDLIEETILQIFRLQQSLQEEKSLNSNSLSQEQKQQEEKDEDDFDIKGRKQKENKILIKLKTLEFFS